MLAGAIIGVVKAGTRRADRFRDHVGSRKPEAIETRRSLRDRGRGRDGERNVAVETRVGRSERPGEPVVRTLGHEETCGLVDRGVGDDDSQRRVRTPLFEGLRSREAGSAGELFPAYSLLSSRR